jgi:hypothetical protein
MGRIKFKTWLIILMISPVCLLVFGIVFAEFLRHLDEREFAHAAMWANNMTTLVLDNEHQWDSVRIIAMSKDGHYLSVEGSVGSEDSLKELHSKLQNPPPYIGSAPVHIDWYVQVETNVFPAIKSGSLTPAS